MSDAGHRLLMQKRWGDSWYFALEDGNASPYPMYRYYEIGVLLQGRGA